MKKEGTGTPPEEQRDQGESQFLISFRSGAVRFKAILRTRRDQRARARVPLESLRDSKRLKNTRGFESRLPGKSQRSIYPMGGFAGLSALREKESLRAWFPPLLSLPLLSLPARARYTYVCI